MRQRGRKSSAAIATLAIINPGQSRVTPRADVSPDVAEIINDLVGSVDAKHFRNSDWPLLNSYAKAILLEQKAYHMLAVEGEIIDTRAGTRANPWLAIVEKAGRQIVAVSARLRLSPQSRLQSKTVGRAATPTGRMPWEEHPL